MKNQRNYRWEDPRSGALFTDKQIQGKRFLRNGLHVKFLKPYTGEKSIKKVVSKPANTKEVVVTPKKEDVKKEKRNEK